MIAPTDTGSVGFDAMSTPYEIDEREFPRSGSFEDQCLFLLQYAILAPSTHNTQPWKFAVHENGIEVFADYTRRLPVADPGSRELLMSVGAAIMNLRIAAAHFGLASRVDYDYSGVSERPLAMIGLAPAGSDAPVDPAWEGLFASITKRHTNRQPFLLSRIPGFVLDRLRKAAEGSQSSLILSTDGKVIEHVANLVAAADRIQQADPIFRKDVAEWMRPDRTEKYDGLTAASLGLTGVASTMSSWTTRALDLGRVRAAHDKNLCIEAPGLMVIAGEDAAPYWLDAGELLEKLLLTVTAEGLQTSYFNMPLQVPDLRLELRSLLGLSRWPQLLLRIGYCLTPTPVTPRRPLEDVLISHMRR
jgi:nitroreductase